ncbi:hypothetical protein EJB05_36941 [Eragrostis curvula]|uniref:Uncharacterized protein n=1 Tax=Eragrostis curvula TaxID=38414 RepID=A0A5J9TZM2_9POAL|nr:hypothetical protein EJB05_36941 [Eragrostis curvula]
MRSSGTMVWARPLRSRHASIQRNHICPVGTREENAQIAYNETKGCRSTTFHIIANLFQCWWRGPLAANTCTYSTI